MQQRVAVLSVRQWQLRAGPARAAVLSGLEKGPRPAKLLLMQLEPGS